jgi:predicted NBD/HSP70 family sugar kinase
MPHKIRRADLPPAGVVRPRGMRQANLQTGLDEFQTHRQLSRAELARLTGLNKATASEIVDDLLGQGFLAPLGVELSDVRLVVVAADLDGHVVRTATARSAADAPTTLSLAADLLNHVLRELPTESVVGIGVGAPGVIAADAGAIEFAPDLGWRNVPVRDAFEARFGLPVVVANRAKAAALAESWTGAAGSVDRMVYVSVGSGISAGIVLDGRLYRGASSREGELGHVTVLPDGPLCACGNRGCLQVLAAAPAILAGVRERLRLSDSHKLDSHKLAEVLFYGSATEALAVIARADADGDPSARATLDQVALYIGIASANVVNLLNPRMLVFGGSVVRAIPQLVERIGEQIRRRAIGSELRDLVVVCASLGESAVALGGATLLLADRAWLAPLSRAPTRLPLGGHDRAAAV